MPFIVRKIEPRYIGRGHVPQDNSCVEIWPVGAELEAIINGALACTLKQLASLLTNAQDIFQGLNDELGDVANRSGILRQRIHQLDNQLSSIDPKKIPVPESDISSFASRKKHFKSLQKPSTGLFSETTRPAALKKLYQQASVIAIRNLDYLKINHNENNDTTAVEMFLCTPILGKRRRDQSLDIESRVPATFDDLRRWTSSEALGDITVPPDCMSRIIQSNDTGDFSGDDAVDHKLPSPEEQVQVIALKFPAEIVAVDISGRGFARMSMRKKLTMAQITSELNLDNDTTVKRRSKIRHNTGRSKNKRRNTIAGTDGKEIKQNIIQQASATKTDNDEDDNIKETAYKSKSTGVSTKNRCVRSISTDILQERDTELTKWNFDAFKAWGRSRLRSMRRQSSDIDKNIKSTSNFASAVDNNNDEINNDAKDLMVVDKINANDDELKLDENEIKQNFSSINNINDNNVATSSIPLLLSSSSSTTTMHTFDRNLSHQSHHQQKIKQQQQKHGNNNNNMSYDVRLRESAVLRRERRKGNNNNNNNTREDPIHSSSGNWSASSESGRTSSIGSEIISSNLPGRSSSSSSSSKLLSHNHGRRLKGRDTPTSSSVTSEASTLTPDIIQDIITYPGDDFETEGETCSIYSCDTEGYYTSFHMDSGLKTLREEELAAANANINNSFNVTLNTNTIKTTTTTDTVTFSNQNHNQLPSNNPNGFVENEYELFGRGSTSTTTSSAGTVCTTLMAGAPPIPPERKSSLTVVAMVHGQNNGGNSPDSGHNTCSSPVESASASSPACYTARSCSELEYSESSDLEGYDRIERLRNKTAISTNRIPSMCVITPSGSDDEQAQQSQQQQQPNFNKILQLHNTNSVSYDELVNKSVVGVGNKIKTCQDSGDYVTIADFRNNKDRYRQKNITQVYANIESKKQSQSPKKSKLLQDEFESAEYVSLSDLPKKSDCSLERKRRQGARVVLDYQGKVIYSSDSLKRRKESHTTFNPGPFIKESSPIIAATNRNEKPHSESPRGIIKPRAFVNLAHQHQQHQQQQQQQQQQSESSIASTVSTASSIATPAELEKVKIEENIKEEDTNWIHSEDNHREKKLQDQKNNISTINYKNLSLANKKRQYSDGLSSGEIYHHHHQSVEELVTPDITRDLGNTLINNSQIELQDNKNKIYNNILDNKKKYESNHQTQRCLMPLNLNTYDGNNQITTSSPLSQKFKENQPSEKMVVNDRLERLERKDFFNNSTLSPIPSSNSYYSNNFYSPSNNSLIKNNKTMSNDELFTAIYKSKRKLNIKNDNEISVGTTSTTAPATIDDSLIDISNYVPDDNNKIGTRHSWSPESSQTNNNIKKLVSPSCINQEMSQKNTKTAAAAMTRLDFKRLLLQQSTKNRSSSLSAAEQLKLSNPSNSSNLSKGTGRQVNYYGINDNNNKQIIPNSTTTIKKLNTLSTLDQRCTNYNSSGWYLSRAQQKTIFPNPYINKHDSINSYNHQKSIWKYQIPRSNILSCTIIEDVAAEETAVEQFLESPSPSPLLTLPSATSSFSPSPSPTLINDSDNNFYKNHFESSENNDIDNIFSNKLFEFDNSTNNDSNNSKLVSAHFEAESLKKRNNELKAQFLSNNKVDNNIIIFDEKNQIKSGPTKDTDADVIIEKSPTSSVIVNNITNNSKVSRNTTTPTSALETAL